MPSQQNYNPNISCNVHDCRFNCKNAECCSLTQIDVHQEDKNVTSEHSTCCHSFESKD